jgi:hypothetical protein
MQRLNIFDLYKSANDKKSNKKVQFEHVLTKCHSAIKNANKHHQACFYEVPEVIIGIPLYNVTDCITYIIHGLKDNGFLVKYIYPKTIYINWDPKVVNKTKIKENIVESNQIEDYDTFLITNKPNSNKNKKPTGKFVLNVD